MVVLDERNTRSGIYLVRVKESFLAIMMDWIENIIEKRTQKIADVFNGFIDSGEKILDIGPGGGWIAREIKKRKRAQMTLLDITDFGHTDLKTVIYDGQKIPFPDNSFDVSLLIFTLHHCSNPYQILKEARRVTRNKVIVIEDIAFSSFNKFLLCLWDVISNLPSLVKLPGENIFFNFKNIAEWQEIFKSLGLTLTCQKIFKTNRFLSHALFVLCK